MSETQLTEKPHAQKREQTNDICLREEITVRMTNTQLPEFRTANGLSKAGYVLAPVKNSTNREAPCPEKETDYRHIFKGTNHSEDE